jgi:uncharacterized protein
MEFEWDEQKDAANRAKHGVGLEEAARMDWIVGTTVADGRFEYGEERFRRYAVLGGRLFVCVFTLRDGRFRIISLRKANSREAKRYGAPQTQQ